MKVLVTGGAGFIGAHICAQLTARGDTPVSLDLLPSLAQAGWAQIEGSVLDTEALSKAASGVDAIIHCAAMAGLWAPRRRPHTSINVEGTRAVIEAARANGAKLVHVSSYTTLISGPRQPERQLDERNEVLPAELLGPYPKSKREAELLVIAAVQDDLDACMVLPSSPVGPGDRSRTPPTRMIVDFANGKLPAYLDCWMNLVDVRAVAQGAIAALDQGRMGERYLLSGADIRLGDFAQMIAGRTGIPAPQSRVPYPIAWLAGAVDTGVSSLTQRPPNAPLTGVRLAGRAVTFSNAKARQALGFEPGALDDALDASLGWLASEGLVSLPAAG